MNTHLKTVKMTVKVRWLPPFPLASSSAQP